MELTITVVLAFLEITFITTGLLLLHGLREQIGKAAFYLTYGALFVFVQIVIAAQLKVIVGYSGADFYIGNSVLLLPLIALVMVVYITEGTLITQRLIIGMVAVLAFFIYLSYITSVQCQWTGFRISQGPTASSLDYLLGRSLASMTGTIVALAVDLFLIPIFFQRLRNLGSRMFFAILGSLMLTQIADSFIQLSIAYWNDPQWLTQISSTYMARAIATIWLSCLVTIYITIIEKQVPVEKKKSLDILFAFFGSYGREKALQKNLVEWESRYRMVIESASDMILIINRNGRIQDSNPATKNILKYSNTEILNASIFSISETFRVLPCKWEKLWAEANIKDENDSSNDMSNKQIVLLDANNDNVDVDASFSLIKIGGNPFLIVVCRNITERNKLIREKTELTEQLYHAQRVESLGRLAGGIAHEFNNILHAIQGHIDLILLFGKLEDESAKKHLQSVMNMVEKASNITVQLLGFARKGPSKSKKIDLRKTISDTGDMFYPLTRKEIEFNIDAPETECFINGDSIQLQQVFLNLFINAMDATSRNGKDEKNIDVQISIPSAYPDNWKPLKAEANPSDYYEIIVKDTGTGMQPKVIERIFEPFFTTKEVGKGTGMGLAMVYGEITNHNGFVHVISTENIGTSFYIYLPVVK